ncbi:hypothetical protein BSLG_001787 [Batrachochytrium salamandrivorans]|nr:hypothetical protein BSLG_001787 [Batrachochytrium salamandrivorans]
MHFNSVIIFLATIATLATELTLAALPSGSCSAPRVRKEWRRLTDGERSAFLSAVKALKARGPSSASASGNGMASWNYDQFVDAHWKNVDVAHGVPDFLPWHRFYIYGYEAALRSIDSSIDLPFWDWSLDSQNPGASDIFSSQSFGGNGRSSDHCVVDGVTAGWKIVYPTKQERPLSDCVTRCNGFTSFYPPEAITGMLSQAQTYDGFRSALESGPHGVVHNQIGGDCGDMGGMYSANDPLFFMHHAMVDRIWARWQDQCNYSFTNLFVSDRNTPMTPFGYSPNDVLSIAAGTPLCYTYGPSASDAPLSSKCPPGTASASTTASSGSSSTTTTTTTATISSSSSSSSSSTESASALQSAIPTLSEDAIKNMLNDSWFKNAPPAGDFSDLNHLRQIQQVSLSWIKMNRLNETFVRQWISSDSLATPVSPVLKRASAFSLFKARWSRSAATPATPVSLTSHPDLHAINTTSAAAAAPTTITSSVDAYPIVENAVIASGPPLHTSTGNSIIVTPSRTLSSTDSHIPSSIPGCMPHQPNSSGGNGADYTPISSSGTNGLHEGTAAIIDSTTVDSTSFSIAYPPPLRQLALPQTVSSAIQIPPRSSSIQNTSSILMYQHAAPPSYILPRGSKSDLTSMHAPHRVSAPPVQKESLQVLINTNGELEPLSSSPLSSPLEYTPSNQRRSIHMGALFTKHKVSTDLQHHIKYIQQQKHHSKPPRQSSIIGSSLYGSLSRRPTSIDNRLSSSHSLVSSLSMDTSNANPSRSSESRRISHSYTTEPVRETFQMVRDYDSKTGNKMINHYMVVRELGRGCHGKVKLCIDTESGEKWAIKIVEKMAKRRFQSKLSAAARAAAESGLEPPNPQLERIKREIAILKKCTHPHVVRLREVIDDPHLDKIYLVLEYLEGGDISWSDHADPPTPALSVSQARDIFRDVVCGVQYLHYQGIVHRDIKPANLLWTADHRVKISDFGVSVFVGHKRKRLDRTSQLSPGSHSKSNISRVRSRYRNDRSRLSLSISRSHSGDDHLDRSGRGVLSDGGIFSDDGGEVTNDEDEYQDADELELAKTAGSPAFFAPELCGSKDDELLSSVFISPDQNSMGNNAEAQLTAHGSSRMDFKSSPFDAFVRSPNALSLEPFHLVPGASTNQPQMHTDATDIQLAVDRLSLRPTLPQSSTSPFARKTIDSLEATTLPSARTVSFSETSPKAAIEGLLLQSQDEPSHRDSDSNMEAAGALATSPLDLARHPVTAMSLRGTNDAHRDSTASRHILYSHNSVSGIDGRFHTPLENSASDASTTASSNVPVLLCNDRTVDINKKESTLRASHVGLPPHIEINRSGFMGKMPAESKTKLFGPGNDQIQDAARAISSPLGEPKASKLHFRDPSGDVDSEDAAEENGPLLGAPIDIWAMGVTLFCFVYGKVPFIAETEYGLFNVIVKQPLILPDKPPITDDLRDLFHRLLDKNPAKRATLNEIRVHPWIIGDMSLETRKRWLDETNPSFQYAERLFVSDDDVSQALTVMDRIRNRIRKISHSFHSLAAGLSFRRRTVSMPSVAGNALTPRAASAQSATASIPDRRALVVSPTAHASNGGMLQSPSLLHLQHPIIRSTSFGGAVPTATTRRSLRTTMMTPSSSLSANPQSQASPSRWSRQSLRQEASNADSSVTLPSISAISTSYPAELQPQPLISITMTSAGLSTEITNTPPLSSPPPSWVRWGDAETAVTPPHLMSKSPALRQAWGSPVTVSGFTTASAGGVDLIPEHNSPLLIPPKMSASDEKPPLAPASESTLAPESMLSRQPQALFEFGSPSGAYNHSSNAASYADYDHGYGDCGDGDDSDFNNGDDDDDREHEATAEAERLRMLAWSQPYNGHDEYSDDDV